MRDAAKGFLTGFLWLLVPSAIATIVLLATGTLAQLTWLLLLTAVLGLLYGLEAGILTIYDLGRGKGWAELLVDMTWSLPNTLFGLVFGNLIYIFFGNPSRSESKDEGWIVYKPRSASGFGNDVLQVLGTVNIGGKGQHEKMHVLQARIFGPLYLPLFGLFYAVNFLIQVLWTITLGWILKVAGVRDTAWFTPPSSSAVSGFFGWIYYATPFELWAYASGNP